MSRIIDRGLEEQSVLIVRMGELANETLVLSIGGYLEGKNVQDQVRELSVNCSFPTSGHGSENYKILYENWE
jgi:hypothetical protein